MTVRRKAFTLIELLVVISIIALLLAVLMPTLSKARTLARRVVCSSRLHQVGVAICTYAASDSMGRLPESNGYKPSHIPYKVYKALKSSFPETPQVLVCPEHTGFKENNVTRCSISELNGIYNWEPFPDSYNKPDSVGMWIGYNYLGGRDLGDWRWNTMPSFANQWVSPRTLNDSGNLALIVDIVEKATGSPSWTEATHRKGGYARVFAGTPPEPEEIGALGGVNLYLDGSAFWCKMNELKAYPRSRPPTYRSYGYWYCDY